MIDEKSIKYLMTFNNINKNLIFSIYNYLNFLSLKTKDYRENYLSYKDDLITKNENINNNPDKDTINKKNETLLKIIDKNIPLMHSIFEKFNDYYEFNYKNYSSINRNNSELCDLYKNQKLKSSKSNQNNEITLKNNLLLLIFKSMINEMNDSIVRESIRNERKNFYLKNKYIKSPKKNNESERDKSINNLIKEYIQNNYKESNIEVSINIINIPSKNYNKYRISSSSSYSNKPQQNNISLNSYNQNAQINIKLFPFNIFISLLLNKMFIYNNKITILISHKYKRKSFSDLILFKKIKNMFQDCINSIYNILFEEKKRKNIGMMNMNNLSFDEESLLELIKRFINYIYDFNLVSKTKCGLCHNIVKYSYSEKTFLPPFYKLYKEKDINQINSKNINEIEQKLFYHEDCFRKIANYSL